MDRNTLRTAVISSGLILAAGSTAAANLDRISFDMVVSKGASSCLPDARAKVKVVSTGTAEDMTVQASGLPANTSFDLFVIQVPKAPFGLSWYLGDVETDSDGEAVQHFRGRFSIETFIVAPGSAPAPVVFSGPFPDASVNPPFNPIQTYHLGLWFNSPKDAQNAHCPNAETPFNGEHNAGIQVLNTSNFADDSGPLRNLKP